MYGTGRQAHTRWPFEGGLPAYAAAHGHEIIVVGYRGHFMGDVLLGSTADRVAPSRTLSGHGGALMLHIPVPRGEDLQLHHLVMDVNGTLSDRGQLIDGVSERLRRLADALDLHLLSADTFGTAQSIAADVGAELLIVGAASDKRAYVQALGARDCVAVGNGANDAPMLQAAELGIAILGPEGAHIRALASATVACRSIVEGLDLLLEPEVLTATLRP